MMFGIPLEYYTFQSKRIAEEYVNTYTRQLVDDIRNTGIVSSEHYERYREQVYSIIPKCKIYIEVARKMTEEDEINEVPVWNTKYDYYNTDEIEEELLANGNYKFKQNDFIRMKVVNSDSIVVAYYGGMIKDENY